MLDGMEIDFATEIPGGDAFEDVMSLLEQGAEGEPHNFEYRTRDY